MSAALRNALLWLVMLALPFQGIAAVGMMTRHALESGALQMDEALVASPVPFADGGNMAERTGKVCERMMAGCDHPQVPGHVQCALSAGCGLVYAPASQSPECPQSAESGTPIRIESNVRVTFSTDAPDCPPRKITLSRIASAAGTRS